MLNLPNYSPSDFLLSPKAAVTRQRQLANDVQLIAFDAPVRYLAGVDVGFEQNGEITRAAVVVLDAEDLSVADSQLVKLPTSFPYIPGLLSFRELPAVLQAYQQLSIEPDVLLCDGQGIAHPRRFGIACHLGVIIDKPTVGIGKTRLVGEYTSPADQKGAWSSLIYHNDVVGGVLRTRRGCKPLFVSPGHRVTVEQALALCMQAVTRFKLPETTRHAHHLASNMK